MKRLLLLALMSCKQEQPSCSAGDNGYGDAPAVKVDVLATPTVAQGSTCRAHVDVLRAPADLASAFAEIGASGPPDVDFATRIVIVRVDSSAASIAWAANRNGTLAVGFQGCQEFPSNECTATFWSAPAPVTRIEPHTCDPVHCGF